MKTTFFELKLQKMNVISLIYLILKTATLFYCIVCGAGKMAKAEIRNCFEWYRDKMKTEILEEVFGFSN